MHLNKIKAIMEKAKQLGITKLECEGIKMEFGPNIPVDITYCIPPHSIAENIDINPHTQTISTSTVIPDMKASDLMKPMSTLDDLSPEEILYAATPYFDELQSKKKLHQEKLNKEVKK